MAIFQLPCFKSRWRILKQLNKLNKWRDRARCQSIMILWSQQFWKQICRRMFWQKFQQLIYQLANRWWEWDALLFIQVKWSLCFSLGPKKLSLFSSIYLLSPELSFVSLSWGFWGVKQYSKVDVFQFHYCKLL